MATIVNTLIEGLTQQMVQTRLNSADAKPFLFGTHFPVKKVNGFTWKTLSNQLAKKNVAADIQSDNSTTLRKRRPHFEMAMGDIPFIAISREMKRDEIKAYQTARAFAPDASAIDLVEYWGEDVDFCFNGVQSELEYIAWKLASNAGVLHFTTTTNATFANEFDLDYGVDDDMKQKTGSNWGNAASADIIGDLVTLVNFAKSKGLNPKYGFINLNELYKICSADQIIKKCATVVQNVTGTGSTPDLAQVNAMLAKQAWLNGIQLRVIDQTITREFSDGSSESGNPFENNRLILSETPVLGSTQYDILAENNDCIIRAERSHTVVKKYGTCEPQSEVTIGQADAVPVFDTAYRNLYVKTNAQNW